MACLQEVVITAFILSLTKFADLATPCIIFFISN